jgi:hypothetical protein
MRQSTACKISSGNHNFETVTHYSDFQTYYTILPVPVVLLPCCIDQKVIAALLFHCYNLAI